MRPELLTKSLRTTSPVTANVWLPHTSHRQVLMAQDRGTSPTGPEPSVQEILVNISPHWQSWTSISPQVKESLWLRSNSQWSKTTNLRGMSAAGHKPTRNKRQVTKRATGTPVPLPQVLALTRGPGQGRAVSQWTHVQQPRPKWWWKVSKQCNVSQNLMTIRRCCSSIHFSPTYTMSLASLRDQNDSRS